MVGCQHVRTAPCVDSAALLGDMVYWMSDNSSRGIGDYTAPRRRSRIKQGSLVQPRLQISSYLAHSAVLALLNAIRNEPL